MSGRARPSEGGNERGMANETGRLLEDYSLICEAAERIASSGGGHAVSGLEVARLGGGGYEVRHNGVLVLRCRAGRPPDVFTPGEWVVRLVQAGRLAA